MSFKTIIRSLSLCLLFAFSLSAQSFPRGCEVTGFGYSDKFCVLNETGEQAIYLIQNRSDSPIELIRHETSTAFMNPPLRTLINSMNWNAFASDVRNLNFTCYKRVADTKVIVDCRDVLDICQYPRVRFALSNMGNYWISENKPQNDVIKEATAKGIYLKW